MKIWHISDTHTFHDGLSPPEDIDIVIHSGDCSNKKAVLENSKEVLEFLDWYASLNIPYKIFVAGNHDTSIEAKIINKKDFIDRNIIYLENDYVVINNKIIWGSPVTPTFGTGWAFNRAREKINKTWQKIPENTNILVTHGPPKSILDLSYDRENNLEYCGCSALFKRISKLEKLECSLFGHIHDNHDNHNSGVYYNNATKVTFSNGSVVLDGRFDKGAVYNGNLIIIN